MMKVMNVLVLLVVVLARGGRVVVEPTNQTQEERRAVANEAACRICAQEDWKCRKLQNS
ncbi:hypothetical protein NFJ02_06g124700 [Pycnococcus provasolii]